MTEVKHADTTAPAATRSLGSHAGPAALDVGRELMTLNWLPAGYAHRDWLGEWAAVVLPRREASARLLMRASRALLDRYGLRQRYLRELGDHAWLLLPHAQMARAAELLAVAMLGGWVRHRLERQQVALQQRVLGPAKRSRALDFASTLRALPFPASGQWPVPMDGPQALFRLGASALAGMLDDESSGARERFTMRFAKGAIMPVTLAAAQRDEALAVIHAAATTESPGA